MKQVLQSLETGVTEVVDVPASRLRAGHLLIHTRASIVSAGTERMLVNFGKANLIDKARQQPEKVRQVVSKVRTDGLVPTLEAVRSKLSQPTALGYSGAGVVIAVGHGVEGFSVGDRVVSNGPHAGIVSVPSNLCAKIPHRDPEIPFEEAAFTVLASIGLQGVRLVAPTLGEVVVVTGLGLIGLLTIQLLRAQGCKVLGIDFDAQRLALARSFGAKTVNLSADQDPVAAAHDLSRGRGVDAVIITASTKSSEPVHQAATMCRKRGRIVLVGVTGLELSRADFYEKELSFQVSCSYGPGRYDPDYEERGHDYPFGFVRWTEGRNFEAVLNLMAEERLDVKPLISHRFTIEEAAHAYELISEGSPSLGVVLTYADVPELETSPTRSVLVHSPLTRPANKLVVGVIGAGNFTTRALLPVLKKADVTLKAIASSGGLGSFTAARKFGFAEATTDTESVFADPEINTVFITTRHDSHVPMTLQALAHGKHVFVEKPLAITREQLAELEQCYYELRSEGREPLLGIGFNRRFAPHIIKMKSLLSSVQEPKSMVITVNAGAVPDDHWVQDAERGGGRIIGEACHFVDLLRHLAGAPITRVQAMQVESQAMRITEDKMSFTLGFADGSIGTVHYFANGHSSFPKERIEVFTAERVLVLDNFRKLEGYGWPNFRAQRLWSQDKGHLASTEAFLAAASKGEPAPIPFEEILEVTKAVFDVRDAAMSTSPGTPPVYIER